MTDQLLAIGATREGTDAAKRNCCVFDHSSAVMFAPGTSPADGLQAARELLGPSATFHTLKNGHPVYLR